MVDDYSKKYISNLVKQNNYIEENIDISNFNWSAYLNNTDFKLGIVATYGNYFDLNAWEIILDKYGKYNLLYELFGDIIIFKNYDEVILYNDTKIVRTIPILPYRYIIVEAYKKIGKNVLYEDWFRVHINPIIQH